jgi:uncharacterized protein YceK
MRKLALIAAICALVLSGCATSRITNLTPTRQPRNESGVYPVEFVWDTQQQSIIDGSLKPVVVIGFDQYPMRPALNIANRFEAVIPVPADKNFTVYHFKVDYMYRGYGSPRMDSKLSPSYRLDISDK